LLVDDEELGSSVFFIIDLSHLVLAPCLTIIFPSRDFTAEFLRLRFNLHGAVRGLRCDAASACHYKANVAIEIRMIMDISFDD